MTTPVEDATTTPFALRDADVRFYRTFGFLHLRGLFANEIDELDAGFEEAFATEETPWVLDPTNSYHRARYEEYADRPREIVAGFIDRSPRLSWLKTDPRITNIATALVGDDPVYDESDGNRFNCDVSWHLDVYQAPLEEDHVKIYFYLDDLTHETGALRMIPGTQLGGSDYTERLRGGLNDPARVPSIYGVEVDEIPAWTLEVRRGDVVVGDFRTLHASFYGRPGRRLFTVNWGRNYHR
jgi:hypothetical protein